MEASDESRSIRLRPDGAVDMRRLFAFRFLQAQGSVTCDPLLSPSAVGD